MPLCILWKKRRWKAFYSILRCHRLRAPVSVWVSKLPLPGLPWPWWPCKIQISIDVRESPNIDLVINIYLRWFSEDILIYSCHFFLNGILFQHDFHHDSCDYHWDFYGHYLPFDLYFRLLYISNSGSANAQLPGCFCPWTFSLNIGLNMFPLDSFMSCLHSLIGYSTGEFQALQLIVLAAFVPWINHLSPVCWSTFWKSTLNW